MRTEFLFQGREKLPTEEEQYQIYKRMLEWAAGKPVTIRTLDAGGDKPIAGLTQPGDMNPFLGVRGVRLSLRHLDVFRAQLRALARAAVGRKPQGDDPDGHGAGRTRPLPRAVRSKPATNCVARDSEAQMPPLGMMVEVPAAALTIEDFNADFFSIGSNDLDPVHGGGEPGRTAACRSRASFARGVRSDPACRGPCQPRPAAKRACAAILLATPSRVAALLDQGLRVLSVAPARSWPVKAAIGRYSGSAA